MRSQYRSIKSIFQIVLILVLPVVIFPFFTEIIDIIDRADRIVLDITALTDDEEVDIGDNLRERILEDYKLTDTRKFDVQAIHNRIKAQTTRTKLKYDFSIVVVDDINAYTIAGGHIFLNDGIITFLDSDDELAFVLAHEMAHNELKHCIRNIQYQVRANQIDPVLGGIVQIAYNTYRIPFNIKQEFEADSLGVKMMQDAGYDKQGAVRFFEKMEELEKEYQKEGRVGVNDFIPSHPNARKRIEYIESL